MGSINTSIEINAPPAVVREKFLDFPSIPTYTPNGFVASITPVNTSITPHDLKPGDKLLCAMGYGKFKFTSTVVNNTPEEFSWCGSLPGIFTGTHFFKFEEIASTTGGGVNTRLVHGERFSGLLAGVYGEGWLGRVAGLRKGGEEGFAGFNGDFKRWVEGDQ
ncbi:hypothetical protein BDV12DRAFT_206677 [Aspergillus spectabilis]